MAFQDGGQLGLGQPCLAHREEGGPAPAAGRDSLLRREPWARASSAAAIPVALCPSWGPRSFLGAGGYPEGGRGVRAGRERSSSCASGAVGCDLSPHSAWVSLPPRWLPAPEDQVLVQPRRTAVVWAECASAVGTQCQALPGFRVTGTGNKCAVQTGVLSPSQPEHFWTPTCGRPAILMACPGLLPSAVCPRPGHWARPAPARPAPAHFCTGPRRSSPASGLSPSPLHASLHPSRVCSACG